MTRMNGQKIGPGILTSKHVTGTTLGSKFTLSCGCTGTLSDIGPEGIDSALITSDCARITTPLHARKLVAPWTDVFFEGSSSGIVTTKVTDVSNTMGIYHSNHLPSKVFIAPHGRPGDSGALIREIDSKKAVGIYIGSLTSPAGHSFGFSQHAQQAVETMEMEMYQ